MSRHKEYEVGLLFLLPGPSSSPSFHERAAWLATPDYPSPPSWHPSLARLFLQRLGPGLYKPHLSALKSSVFWLGKIPIFTEKDLETP